MKKNLLYWLALAVVVFAACQKELSFELPNTPAEGSLQSDVSGDCLPKTVNGAYAVGAALGASNTLTVAVNVTKTGTYTIGTDTVNGYFFRGTGTFSTTGVNSITLRGNGTPFAAGTNNFVVSFDSTVCDIQVIVTQPGAGTLAGSPSACAPITVNGGYSPGAVMTAGNSAVVQVNVTTAGAFTITTDTIAGIWFTYSGNLGTGPQAVTLQANGTIPTGTANGNKTFKVTLGSSTCTFDVNVSAPATGTVDCTGASPAGTYMVGTALVPGTNTVQIQVNVTGTGNYTITTDTVHGMWFNASGNFAATGVVPVTLAGNGTPDAAGTWTFTVKFGASTCTFNVTVVPVPDYFPRTTNSNWSYEFDDNPLDSLYRTVIAATKTVTPNIFNIFMGNDGTGLDSSGYYRRNSGDYFEWFDAGGFLGFDNPVWGEYIMVKDNVAATTVWKSAAFNGTVTAIPLSVRFSYTILQKDVPISVTTSTGTVNYTNVIVVEEKIEAFDGTNWVDVTAQIDYYGKSYYARNVGLIKFEAYDAANNITLLMELRRSQVF